LRPDAQLAARAALVALAVAGVAWFAARAQGAADDAARSGFTSDKVRSRCARSADPRTCEAARLAQVCPHRPSQQRAPGEVG
jgi:hypothetical protein